MKLLLKDKPCRLLQAVSKQTGKKGINEIGKSVYATYKSRWEIINELEQKDIVYLEKFGREVVPFLTPKGEKVLMYINYITSL